MDDEGGAGRLHQTGRLVAEITLDSYSYRDTGTMRREGEVKTRVGALGGRSTGRGGKSCKDLGRWPGGCLIWAVEWTTCPPE